MRLLTEWLQKSTGIPAELYGKLFTSLSWIIVLWFFRWLILKGVRRRTENSRTRYQWRKISNYVASSLAFLLLGRVWLSEFESVATYLGLLSAGLAIAMKDPLVNVAGWLFILWRRPFEVGDRIQIGAHAGDIIDMRIFQFTLMEIGSWVHADQSTGRIVHTKPTRVGRSPLSARTGRTRPARVVTRTRRLGQRNAVSATRDSMSGRRAVAERGAPTGAPFRYPRRADNPERQHTLISATYVANVHGSVRWSGRGYYNQYSANGSMLTGMFSNGTAQDLGPGDMLWERITNAAARRITETICVNYGVKAK